MYWDLAIMSVAISREFIASILVLIKARSLTSSSAVFAINAKSAEAKISAAFLTLARFLSSFSLWVMSTLSVTQARACAERRRCEARFNGAGGRRGRRGRRG